MMAASVPLPQALESLQTKLRALLLSPPPQSSDVCKEDGSSADESTETSTNAVASQQSCFIRIEEHVLLAGDDHVDALLRWLRAQPQQETPRGFFVSRDRKTAVAAVGSARTVTTASSGQASSSKSPWHGLKSVESVLSVCKQAHPRARLLGGLRFDLVHNENDSSWSEFGDHFWFLPAIELSVDVTDAVDGAADSTSTKCVLATQVYYDVDAASTTNSLSAQVSARLNLLAKLRCPSTPYAGGIDRFVPPCAGSPPYRIPVVVGESPTDEFEQYEQKVQAAVNCVKRGELAKVVLARSTQLKFDSKPNDPLDVLLTVLHRTKDSNRYIFYLEPEAGHAFTCVSPEMLAKVSIKEDGMQVNSESLAGTWPREVLEKVGEEELLRAASSEKNKNEHQIVSDYVHSKLCTIAGREHVRVTDVKLLPMKHLVHIKQTYEAIVPNCSSKNSNGNSSNLVSPASSLSEKQFGSNPIDLIPEDDLLLADVEEVDSPAEIDSPKQHPKSITPNQNPKSIKKQISASPTMRTVSSSGSFAHSESAEREFTTLSTSRGDVMRNSSANSSATTAASSRSGSARGLSHHKSSNWKIMDCIGTTVSPKSMFLNDGCDPLRVLAWIVDYLHPTPAVGGVPLQPALEFIREKEAFDRGFYAAPCGLVGVNGGELLVGLRSALVKGDRLHIFAGGGLVSGSSASEEWDEVLLKMRQFREAFPKELPSLSPNAADHSPDVDNKLAPSLLKLANRCENMNTLHCALVVEELVRHGVTHFCVAPGSRSTPLVIAVSRHPQATHVIHNDERGTGFYALGHARATNRPCAVIVTSGTAVANLLPAVVEASLSAVPLILLTADRPPELRDRGASQTITQVNIFGSYTVFAKDLPCPEANPHASQLKGLLADIDQAVFSAQHGPVQLNFMFRENLAPDGGAVRGALPGAPTCNFNPLCLAPLSSWAASRQPLTQACAAADTVSSSPFLQEIAGALADQNSRPLVIVGELRDLGEQEAIRWVCERTNSICCPDLCSGLRMADSKYICNLADQIVGGAAGNDAIVKSRSNLRQQLVVVGGSVVSARLNSILSSWKGTVYRIAPYGWQDASCSAAVHIQGSCADLARAVSSYSLSNYPTMDLSNTESDDQTIVESRVSKVADDAVGNFLRPGPSQGRFKDINESFGNEIDILTEPFVARAVSTLIPSNHALFVSSSMPIRDLNFYSKGGHGVRRVGCNRGAAGIDGVISTSIGFAAGAQVPTTLLIGDLATLHDTSALQHLKSAADRGVNMCIVVVNNSGGGIFKFLPIAKHDKKMYDTFFTTPQDVDFQKLVEAHHVTYKRADTSQQFQDQFSQIQEDFKGNSSGSVVVLEAVISTSGDENIKLHQAIMGEIDRSVSYPLCDLVPNLDFYFARVGSTTNAPNVPCGGPFDEQEPTLVFLHGWMGCKEDWEQVLRHYDGKGDVIVIDLPGCGDSPVGDLSFLTIDGCARAVIKVLHGLCIRRNVVFCGYSLGGRIAMAIARLAAADDALFAKNFVTGLILIGANPAAGLQDWEREERYLSDRNIADKLTRKKKMYFLDKWYDASLWANLKTREPEVYRKWIGSRRFCADQAAQVLLGCSLANQVDFGKMLEGCDNAFVLVGSLDKKFCDIHYPENVHKETIDGAGHLLIAERPKQVADFCRHVVRRLVSRGKKAVAPLHDMLKVEIITKHVPLTSPLPLSRGTITHRESALLLLKFETFGFVGVGELCPLPGWHREDFSDALEVLQLVACAFEGVNVMTFEDDDVPFDFQPFMDRFSSVMDEVLREHVTRPPSHSTSFAVVTYPSVRAAFEMALFHAAAQISPSLIYLRPRSLFVRFNGLYTRREGSGNAFSSKYEAVKVKIGMADPTIGQAIEEAERINAIARACGNVKLRLDANQCFGADAIAEFLKALTPEAREKIEYIEEPVSLQFAGCTGGQSVLDAWTQYWNIAGIPFAVDESYYEGKIGLKEVLSLPQGAVKAWILKPAMLGICRTIEVAQAAAAHGITPVISSAFESGVALAHYTLLAASLPAAEFCSSNCSHGLSTFERLADDVLSPSFKSMVQVFNRDVTIADSTQNHGRSTIVCSRINTMQLRRALDETADQLWEEKDCQRATGCRPADQAIGA